MNCSYPMNLPPENLDELIIARGKYCFARMQGQKPSLFDKSRWIGKMMDVVLRNENFKVQLFRFIDVFPSLKTSKLLSDHIREYFSDQDLPRILKLAGKIATYGGRIGTKFLNTFITFNIKSIAKQFMIGENIPEAIKTLARIREEGFAFTIDILGESTITQEDADKYQTNYFELLRALEHYQHDWKAHKRKGVPFDCEQDWGYAPISQISVKVSGLEPQINLLDFENSINRILQRLKPIYRKIIEIEGSLCIDMETYQMKAITFEVFRRLRSDPEFKHYTHLGIALQAYLRDTANDLEKLLAWARNHKLPIEIRLVKGAYWDYETIVAEQNGWAARVWDHKSQTDTAFETLAQTILENHDICYFACGSHNIRSIAAVIEMAKWLVVPESRYEFQLLYGMAEPIAYMLKEIAGRVRLYCPYGEMIPGMSYFVRRLLENTANESFLRQGFSQEDNVDTLLKNPKTSISDKRK